MRLNDWLNNSDGIDRRLRRNELNLRNYVSRLEKHETMLALWEVQRLQVGIDKSPPRIVGLPIGGLGASIAEGKPYFPPWVIEQIINIVSIFGNSGNRRDRLIDVFQWENLAQLHNLVRNYNDARTGAFLKTNDVFENLSKIGRQQFHWQDGSLGLLFLEMYATLYLGDACNRACKDRHQISADEFLSYGFIIFSGFSASPYIELPYDLSIIDGEQKTLKTVLNRYSLSTRDFNQNCRILRRQDSLGEYSKSQLRMKPIIRLADGRYFCPMPRLIHFRITSGLISETSYSGAAINEVADNFEMFSFNKFSMAFPETLPRKEETYGTKQRPKKTPDIRAFEGESLRLIIECKATLLLFEDKFENVDLENLPKKSEQIVKGILQVWRYVRDSYEGLTPDEKLGDDCSGLILTLEDWVLMDRDRYDLLLERANELADEEKIPNLARVDTAITSIKDFLYILQHATFSEFLKCLNLAKKSEFNGYILRNVFREMHGDRTPVRDLSSEETINQKVWYWERTRTESNEAV